jgi:sortase A
MRRLLRTLGTLMVVAGLGTLGWSVLVWQWQDPFTALYERYEQGKLESSYEARAGGFRLPAGKTAAFPAADLRRVAQRYRAETRPGEALGVLTIGSLGLRKVVVNGTDHDSLMRGPGRDPHTYMPGQGRLVYIAGHRTTYGAPFSHIDEIGKGDYLTLEVPYAKFTYRVTGHVVVPATAVDRLRSKKLEQLVLQACHPRFFASHRYLVYAKLVSVTPRTGGGQARAIAAPAARAA